MTAVSGPHQDQPLVTAGAPLSVADAVTVLIHGRGATAQGIINLADEFYQHGMAYLAPQANHSRWYPYSFLAPVESNEPDLSSGLQAISDAIETATDAGIPRDRVLLFGFSQGACLASEFVARDPRRYGGLVALSGGLIGPDVSPADYRDGNEDAPLQGMPVFLGCSDDDPHIPLERVHVTAEVFESLGGDVTERIYEGMGHEINDDEFQYVSSLVTALLDRDTAPNSDT